MNLSINPISTLNKPIKKINYKTSLPLAVIPILAYMNPPKIRTKERDKLIEKEQGHLARPVEDRTEYNTKQLKACKIKEADIENYLTYDGHVTEEGKKILKENHKSFKGLPENVKTEEFSNAGEYSEQISEMPLVYDNAADMAEISELDNAINAIDTVLDNPLLLTAAAEMVPFARFIKPMVDLSNGDAKKATIGTISRWVDTILSPLKLLMATTMGVSDSIIRAATGDKDFSFIKGFKRIYNDWAEGRDAIEDEILGRETKEQKLERLRKLKAEKVAERQRKMEEIKRKAEQSKCEQQTYTNVIYNFEKENTAASSNSGCKYENKIKYHSDDKYLEKQRDNFRDLLNRLKGLAPGLDLSMYENYYRWEGNKLATNANILKNKIAKFQKRSMGITKNDAQENNRVTQKLEHEWLEKDRELFGVLLEELKSLKPNANLSQYENYRRWNSTQLSRNGKLLKNMVNKYKTKN